MVSHSTLLMAVSQSNGQSNHFEFTAVALRTALISGLSGLGLGKFLFLVLDNFSILYPLASYLVADLTDWNPPAFQQKIFNKKLS